MTWALVVAFLISCKSISESWIRLHQHTNQVNDDGGRELTPRRQMIQVPLIAEHERFAAEK